MKITLGEVVYDIVKEKEIKDCRGCFLCDFSDELQECFEITKIDCVKEKVIFLKVPNSLKCCENCGTKNLSKCIELNCKNYDKWVAKE